jgi:hypothetical protein
MLAIGLLVAKPDLFGLPLPSVSAASHPLPEHDGPADGEESANQ